MISYDYSHACADVIGASGVTDAALAALGPKLADAIAGLQELYDRPSPSFLAVPDHDVSDVQALAAALVPENDNALIIGIGGSSLGAKCVYNALIRPLSGAWRDGSERDGLDLVFVENVDPVETADLLDCLPLDETVFNVITKSGGTVETMSTFFAFRERLLGADAGLYQAQVVATTDLVRGTLRELVRQDGLQSLAIPPGVGGRFSVFTPAGTFPLALAGVDIEAFLRGAARAREASLRLDLAENPAAAFAAIQVALYEAGVHDVVLMPYASGMRDMANWFVQLWAESLGKSTEGGPVGPTPIPAVGATDQHSQLQLFMEGPATKNVVFIAIEADPVDVTIPEPPPACAGLAHIGGKTLHQIRNAELAGVRAGLTEVGRPSSTFTLPSVDAESLGELLMTLSAATAIAGSLMGVDPFDQPGVELAKKFAHGILGSAAEAEYAERLAAANQGVVARVSRT